MTNRKHHCRKCGDCVCDSCSTNRLRLPGYSVPQRLCKGCFRDVSALNRFVQGEMKATQNNVQSIPGCIRFQIYARNEPPYQSPVWLSETMMMIMFKSADGKLKGLPIWNLEEIVEGQVTSEFEDRLLVTTCGCFSTPNTELKSISENCFSLRFSNGRTLDLSTSSTRLSLDWIKKFTAMQSLTPFAKYHVSVSRIPEVALVRMEEQRLQALSSEATKRQGVARATRSQEKRTRAAITAKYKDDGHQPLLDGGGHY